MHSNTRSFQRARFEVWIVWKFGFELDFSGHTYVWTHGQVSRLSANTHAVHKNGGGDGPPGAGAGPSPRLEKLPWPTVQLDMSQLKWAFQHSQWKAYISQTVVQEATKVQQLRAACTNELLRRVYDAGDLASLNTEELLMQQIKKIAVRVVHKTLHLQNMWSMT